MADKNYIQIFGERNSGTNYLHKLLEKNFEGITVGYNYGWKHGFTNKIRKRKNEIENVVTICIFKNPLAWFLSMHKKPHHAPQMRKLSFSDFLRTEWVCYRGKEYFKRNLKENPFKPEEEMLIERDPKTGERFENVIKLRSRKNEHYLALENIIKDVEYIRYEDLLTAPEKIFKELAEKYNLKGKSIFEDSNKYHGKSNKETFSNKNYYLNKEYISFYNENDLNYIKDQLDISLEEKLGYNI